MPDRRRTLGYEREFLTGPCAGRNLASYDSDPTGSLSCVLRV
jgi:hypothetical protein